MIANLLDALDALDLEPGARTAVQVEKSVEASSPNCRETPWARFRRRGCESSTKRCSRADIKSKPAPKKTAPGS